MNRPLSLDIRSLLPSDTAVIPTGFYCGDTTLTSLDLSKLRISVIESDCFRYLHSLTELIFSRELVRIESGSFRGLVSIRLIDLSNCSMLRVLEDDTFMGAHSLRALFLPDGLLEIGSGVFRELISLENLTIPASVMTISSRAFGGCFRLKQVTLRGRPNIDPNAFKRCHPDLTFVHECSSEVKGCRLQPGQAAARGGEMRVAVVEPPVHSKLPSLQQHSSEVEGSRLQPGQAAARGGEMRVAVVEPPVHSKLQSLQQHSSEVEGSRLQPGQAAAVGGRMEVAVDKPSMHPDSPFHFPCYIGRYDALKGKLQFEQDANGFMCQITYEEFVDDIEIVILLCGHAFSVIGMIEWYSKKCDDTCCPSCMKKLH